MRNNSYQFDTNPKKYDDFYDIKSSKNVKKKVSKKQVKSKKNNTASKKVNSSKSKEKNKETKNSNDNELKLKTAIFIKVALLIAIVFVIILQGSKVNESFNRIQTLKTQVAALEKENDQLQINIQNSLNLNNIEQAAKELLGMQKLTSKQTVYITLPKKDYVEYKSEEVVLEESSNWFTNLIDNIVDFFD